MNAVSTMTRSQLLDKAYEAFPQIPREKWAARGITNTVIRNALTAGVLPPSLATDIGVPAPSEKAVPVESIQDAISTIVGAVGTGPASKEQILEQVRVVMKEITPVKVIKVRLPDKTEVDVRGQHAQFHKLLSLVNLREEVLLFGPPGVGKSYSAKAAAEAVGLEYGELSVGPTTTESKLLGYQDANGRYVSTEFRRRYEEGGVFLLDETDNGNGSVMAVLNNALSTGRLAFPDAVIERNDDFVLIATANTVGTGATREFLGRQPLDAAFRDRFSVIDWNIDVALEGSIAEAKGEALGLDPKKVADWIETVRKIRNGIEKSSQFKVMATPRAVYKGIALLSAGWKKGEVEDAVIWKGCPPEIKRKVKEHCN